MAFFEVISTMFGVLFYALLATMALMGLIFVLLRAIDKRRVGTIPFFIIGIFFAVFLVVQFTMMFGAMKARASVSDLEETVNVCTDVMQNGVAALSEGMPEGVSLDPDEILSKVKEDYQNLEAYGAFLDLKTEDLSAVADGSVDISENIFQMAFDRLSTYIWHRVWWIIGISLLSIIVVLLLPGKKTSYGGGQYSSVDGSFGSSSSEVGDWGF